MYPSCLLGGGFRFQQPKDTLNFQLISKHNFRLYLSPVPGSTEHAIHDHVGFGSLDIPEHAPLDTISEVAQLLSSWDPEVVATVVDRQGLENLHLAVMTLNERHLGSYLGLDEWAQEYLEQSGQLGAVSDSLRPHLDLEAFAADMHGSGDVFSAVDTAGNVHVFANH